jgi:hypothetical protein
VEDGEVEKNVSFLTISILTISIFIIRQSLVLNQISMSTSFLDDKNFKIDSSAWQVQELQ